MYATCALLYNYPDRPFPAGAQLRPEVAKRCRRSATAGERTRSTAARLPVLAALQRARDRARFRRAIERALTTRTGSSRRCLSDIVGAAALHAGRAKRLAGVAARGDTLTIRLTARRRRCPRGCVDVFCAVPPTTPISASGIEQIPMAGPYYIASYVPSAARAPPQPELRRDTDRPVPRDRLRSRRRRRRAAAAVEAGRATTSPPSPGADRGARPALRAAQRRGAPGRSATSAARRRSCTTSPSTRAGRCSPPDACAKR